MSLWLRLVWVILASRFKPALAITTECSVLNFRVWPHDLDPSLHMNNGRYLTLMDLGRLDLMLRSGLWRAVLKNRWTPIASANLIRYRRELAPFQRFRLDTRLVNWSDSLVVMEQTFRFAGGARDGQVAAQALFKGGIYDRSAKQFVAILRLMETIGVRGESPPPAPEVEAFLRADNELKLAGRD